MPLPCPIALCASVLTVLPLSMQAEQSAGLGSVRLASVRRENAGPCNECVLVCSPSFHLSSDGAGALDGLILLAAPIVAAFAHVRPSLLTNARLLRGTCAWNGALVPRYFYVLRRTKRPTFFARLRKAALEALQRVSSRSLQPSSSRCFHLHRCFLNPQHQVRRIWSGKT